MAYPGSKTAAGVVQQIVSQFPPHRVYIEPFVGTGAVLFAKLPADRSVVIDLDPVSVAGVVARAAFSGFHACERSLLDLAVALPAAAVACVGAVAGSPRDLVGVVTCGIRALEAWSPAGDELLYCDPPYLVSARGGRRRRYYANELRSVGEHERLLSVLRKLSCAVAISGYRCEVYDSLLSSWRRVDYMTSTRGGPIVESLWCNYPPPAVLHDARYFGGDRRRRQDFHRMIKRWQKKFFSLDSVRRAALLATLQAQFQS